MKQFHIYGQTIKIGKARMEYNHYRHLFLDMAAEAQREFEKLYQQNKSLDDVIKNGPNQMESCVQPGIDLIIQELVDQGILTYDAERLEEEYSISDIWGEAYLKIYDQFAAIEMNEQELNEYRTARRENRGRWQGGGFGVEGAIKGAMTAGAMNMVTGAGHMIFNGLGNIVTSISSSSKRNAIFKNPQTFDTLAQGVGAAVFSLHYIMIECLEENHLTSLPAQGMPSDEDEKDAARILNNLDKIKGRDQAVTALFQALEKDPYSVEWYQNALERFGDQPRELERMANYFGVIQIREEKERQLECFAQGLSLENEETAINALELVDKKKEFLGFKEDTPAVEQIRQAVEEFDTAYRTVEDVLHDTREEADHSRQDLEQIREIEAAVDLNDLNTIVAAEEKMSGLTSAIAHRHQTALKSSEEDLRQRLRTIDLHLETCTSYLCESAEEAEQLRARTVSISGELSTCMKAAEPIEALSALGKQLKTELLPQELEKIYQREIAARIHVIEAAPRTAMGKEYATVDERENAESAYQALEQEVRSAGSLQDAKQAWEKIDCADFSQEASDTLRHKLHERLKSKQRASKRRYQILLLALVVFSMFFTFSVSVGYAGKGYALFGNSLLNQNYEISQELGLVDGIKDGILICGRTIGDNVLSAFFTYIGGFDRGIVGNILWLILGWFYVIIKYMLLFVVQYIVTFLGLLFQRASILYYVGYLPASYVSWKILCRAFKEDETGDNLEEFKKKLDERN